MAINRGYCLIRQLLHIPEEQRENMCIDLLDLEKSRKKIRAADAEVERKTKISKLFCEVYGMAVQMIPTVENFRA